MEERVLKVEHLIFMGQSHLSFFKSCLYLRLLLLKLFADLLQLMNVLSTFTKLLSQVRDFLYKS